MTDDIDRMHAEMMERRRMVAQLDHQLRDYYTRRARLQTEIIATFPFLDVDIETRRQPPFIAVVRWTRERAAERANIIGELDRLTETFGPIVTQRRNLSIEADGLARAIERMQLRAAEKKREHQRADLPLPTMVRKQREFDFT